jgi:uncharacterized lipoprotein YddW (UPF0748 family)
MRPRAFCWIPACAAALLVATHAPNAAPASAPVAIERQWRAVWVDTFNTTLNTPADIVRVVRAAEQAQINVLLAQVRRRGDAWYLDAREPLPDFTPIAPGFDPLADLIDTAHAAGIQVHAFVIVGAVWHKDPSLAPPTNGPPQHPDHVFNRRGGYNAATRSIAVGRDNWLTRTLLPDGSATSYQGHRIGNDFWLDFGHPDAATYTVDVLAHLVQKYDIDGLHLDRIRYPELGVTGQTPTSGVSIGYNPVSVARFLRHHRLPPDTVPLPGDPRWSDWRRMQVTNLVRRVYLTVTAIKPQLVVSAALIAFGGGPGSDEQWRLSEAYWRVFQDWRAWMQEGILDVGAVMNYKREHDATQARQFDDWLAFIAPRQYDRLLVAGIGAHLNGVEGSLRQSRRALATSPGVAFFSLATASDIVTNNPYSWPPGQSTPRRAFADLAAALTLGRSVDGTMRYEPPGGLPPPFASAALVPVLPWKDAPRRGHLAGYAILPPNTPLDTTSVLLIERRTGARRTLLTDGSGFFGAVDLDPGEYSVHVSAGSLRLVDRIRVVPGRVATVHLTPTLN